MNSERTHIVRLSQRGGHTEESVPLTLLPRRNAVSSVTDLRTPTERVAPQRVHVPAHPTQHSRRVRSSVFFPVLIARVLVIMLVPMLLIHPLIPAYAADESVADSGAASVSVESVPPAETVTEPVPAPAETTPETTSDILPTESSAPTTEAGGTESTQPPQTQGDTEGTASTEPSIDETGTTGTGTVESQNPTGDTTSTPGSTDTPPETASSTDEVAIDPTASSTASTTISTETDPATDPAELASTTEESVETALEEEVAAPAETPEQTVTRLLMEREGVLRNQLRKEIETEFTKGCVTMDQVGYYCLKEGTPGTSMLAPSEAVTAVSIASGSVVPAQQVYITKGGVTSELTHDPWDSAFPATDLSGHSVVWQGNVNGRWQIFFANVSGTGTPEEIQVTHAAESNFNPRVEGNTVVWQGWVDGNWEIYRATRLDASVYLPADQSLPEEYVRLGVDRTWDLERITHNDTHDMFPAIAGGLITWQSFQDGTWSVFAYSTQMKTTTRLSQNGAKSENPRFSVTWDERGADGQTRLMGYDIATGKIVDISSEARQLPNDSKPYTPTAPITQNDQAALPITTGTTTATSTRADGDDGTTGNGLDI